MRIIETDTNEQGQTVYMLQMSNATGTLIIATVIGPNRITARYLLSGKGLTARNALAVRKLVCERIANERQS